MFRLSLLALALLAGPAAARPNVVWIVVDDMSAHFGCYGEKLIRTPHVDRLAAEGTLFRKAFTTAPVCSPCRSALVTGCYQTTIGAHHHRSGRGQPIALPAGVTPVPALFQKAGYFTCIGGHNAKGKALGKTDYNFAWDRAMYDGNDWAGRKPGQPFFMQVQLHGGKHRGQGPNKNWQGRVQRELGSNTKPDAVTLPPYYPRDPVILQDWADYLDCCRYTDKEVGDVLARLEKEKLLDETVIFFMTDHGISHARGKQFLYDEGTHIPFVVRGPGIGKGVVRDDLIEHIDMTAASLALAGIEIPKWMQGRDVLAKDYAKRDAVFSARDRCDETMDRIRSVRTDRFKYIRNYLNQRPLLQPCRYKDEKAVVKTLRDLHGAKKLDALTEKLLFAETRPAEELYDLAADPHELTNLVADPAHATTLAALRKKLADWEEATGDKGRTPEPMERYDAEMKVYLGGAKKGNEELQRNIDLNRKWAKEGK
jgi:arylsulfatase A-like enzyme